MLFEGLNEKFQTIFSRLKRKGKLNEKDIQAVSREIKLALLEADVNFKVVKQFTKNISERAVGVEVMNSLTPGQQFIKIVNDEMTKLLGGDLKKIDFVDQNIFMMVGLQGAGKTTTAGKVANLLRKEKKFKPLLIACDVYRPAAVKQLEILGEELNIDVYSEQTKDPVGIAKRGLEKAEEGQYDLVIVDTAGRLQIDEALMEELVNVKATIKPTEILLTVDGMTGQESLNVANEFNRLLDITGVILTKLDGDTRGGAALSITHSIQKSIKYIGTGEKLTDIELFYPDRMASRILGMGDVLSFIDKAQGMMDEEQAKKLEEKIRNQEFDLNDFLEQIKQIEGMGSINSLLEMMPGANKKALKGVDLSGAADTKKTEAIILSMTMEERHKPGIINANRKKRIALGSGTKVSDVNRLLKGFEQSRKMMKQMSNPNIGKKGRFKLPFM